jgi:hypothetical protein
VLLNLRITEGAAEERILFHLLMKEILGSSSFNATWFFILTDVLLTDCDGFHGDSMEVPWTTVNKDIYNS